jgi:cadmium resistance protein CadD (predicted permease)
MAGYHAPNYPVQFLGSIILSVVNLLVAIFYFIYKFIHWKSFQLGFAPLVIGMFFSRRFSFFDRHIG